MWFRWLKPNFVSTFSYTIHTMYKQSIYMHTFPCKTLEKSQTCGAVIAAHYEEKIKKAPYRKI